MSVTENVMEKVFKDIDDFINILKEESTFSKHYMCGGKYNVLNIWNRKYDERKGYVRNPNAKFYFYSNKKVFGSGDPDVLNIVRIFLDRSGFDIR